MRTTLLTTVLALAGAFGAGCASIAVTDEAIVERTAFAPEFLVRAFDRGHSLRLINAGVDFEIRETFESALKFGARALVELGVDEVEAAIPERAGYRGSEPSGASASST